MALAGLLALAPGATATGLFSRLPGEMLEGRYAPAVGLLPAGKVLISGGYGGTSTVNTAELYDPARGMFEKLAATQVIAHDEQATVSLPDGHVLLVGGWNSTTHGLKTLELFDPATLTFEKLTSEMAVERDGPGAALLPDGKVLIVDGAPNAGPDTPTAEIYDPATKTLTNAPSAPLAGRYQPVAVSLPNGKVLISGGYSGEPASEYTKTAELYDPATGKFTKLEGAGHEPTERRDEAGGVTLQNGRVLIAGGYNQESNDLKSAEAFDYATDTFTKLPDLLSEARDGTTAVLLPDGRALFVAGYNEALPLASRYLKSIDVTSVAPATPVTTSPSAVAATSATLHGTVLTEAAASATFQYGTTAAYGTTTPAVALAYAPAAQAVAANVAGLAAGTTYHYRVVAHNAGGTSYGADQTFTTAPPVPALASARQARLRWREGNAPAKISRRDRLPVGTSFSFVLNTAAKVTFAFTQPGSGRRVRGRCVAPTARNHHARRCSRAVTRGTLTFEAHSGENKVAFQGRISRRQKLRPGRYTLVISAVGPAGSAAPQRLTFTIVG